MKKLLLTISLMTLVGNIKCSTEYRFTGEKAVEHLAKNGECRKCDLSNQDLRESIERIVKKQPLSSKSTSTVDLSNSNLTNALLTSEANTTGATLTGATVSMPYKAFILAIWTS